MSLPEWFGPSPNVVGGVERLELVAARSEDAVVWLESATAYPTGVDLRIDVRWRAEVQNLVMRAATWPHERQAGEELPAELFRAGIELADGAKATWLGPGGGAITVTAGRSWDEKPRGPLLRAGVGGGGSQRWSQDLWLWPLPPPGRLEFVCEWPALGIDLTRTELDSDALRTAATRSKELFGADR